MAKTNAFRVLAVMVALALAAFLLVLVAAEKPAKAAFPGRNGSIAFVSDRNGNDEIYVTNSDGTAPTRLTNNSSTDRVPALSPDGRRIAFLSNRADGFQIYVMDAKDRNGDDNGDNLRRLTDTPVAFNGFPISWSPDGNEIAFTRNAGGSSFVVFAMDANKDEHEQSAINLTSNSAAADGQPAFSPDGKSIALISNRGICGDVLCNTLDQRGVEIYVMNADGSNPTRLTYNKFVDRFPEFSPYGHKIAFSTDRDSTPTALNYEIYAMNTDGSAQTNLTNDATLNDRYSAWSPDGNKIAFWSGQGNGLGTDAEIRVMDSTFDPVGDPTGAITGASTPPSKLTDNYVGDVEPDWAPDKTAPTTTASLSPQPNEAGWNNSDVIVGLSAEDQGGSGIEKITYSASGSQTIAQKDVSGGSVQIPLSQEGITTLNYYATDKAGNVEAPKSLTISIDKTPPEVSETRPLNNSTGVEATANISATFLESGSGMDPNTLTASTFKVVQVKPTGDVPVAGTVAYTSPTATFDPDSGLDKGLYRAILTTDVKDNAGNALSDNYTWLFSTAGPSKR